MFQFHFQFDRPTPTLAWGFPCNKCSNWNGLTTKWNGTQNILRERETAGQEEKVRLCLNNHYEQSSLTLCEPQHKQRHSPRDPPNVRFLWQGIPMPSPGLESPISCFIFQVFTVLLIMFVNGYFHQRSKFVITTIQCIWCIMTYRYKSLAQFCNLDIVLYILIYI